MERTTFGDLYIGDEFRFDLGIESGLSIDNGKPGRIEYRKVSARKWECDKYGLGRIGSVKARVWRTSERLA